VFTLVTHLVLTATHRRACPYLFHVTAVLGMVCMAFAFGQNDLANAASPGLAGLTLWRHGGDPMALADIASKIPIPTWTLFCCGALMTGGMFTSYAQRVTRAEVNTGSQYDDVELYAPEWCRRLARYFLRLRGPQPVLAPAATRSASGKKVHYDTLRASVITGVSASVIAFASGRGLPVSTTYVAFAAVLGSGLSDHVFSRGAAEDKVGRAFWVVSCWFLAPVIAVLATGCVARIVFHLSTIGLLLCILLNLGARAFFRRRADAHEKRYHAGAAVVDGGTR